MIQLALASFGLIAIWMAMGHNERARRWAPWVGLAGQPFWFMFALNVIDKLGKDEGWGLMVAVCCFTAAYIRGAWVQRRKW